MTTQFARWLLHLVAWYTPILFANDYITTTECLLPEFTYTRWRHITFHNIFTHQDFDVSLKLPYKSSTQLASFLINAKPPSGTPPRRRWQLLAWLHKPQPNRWLVTSQYEFRCSFGHVLLSNQIYLTTMYRSTIPLRFIWSICPAN